MKKTPEFHALTKLSLFVVLGALAALGTACGSSSSNPPGGTGGAGGGGGAGGAGDTARYSFETSVQGWGSAPGSDVFTTVMTSTAQHFAGASSLAAQIENIGPAIASYSLEIVFVPPAMIAPSTPVTFHVFIPTGAPIDWVQPYVQEDAGAPMPYRFTGTYVLNPTAGTWLSLVVMTPVDVTPVIKVGVQIHNNLAYTGPVYVDSVNWPGTP
jgi:endoglucanase